MTNSKFSLSNKVVVVTGGAGLIGSQFCKEIGLNGGIPVIADLNMDAAKKVSEEFAKDNIHSIPIAFDITNKKSIEEGISLILKKVGDIHGLVNNAYPRNKNYGRKLFDVTYDDFCENVSLHLGGYFLCSQVFAKYFTEKKAGSIVNISSIYGVVAPDFSIYEGTEMTMPVEYAAIKSSVIHLTQYFAAFLKGSNIRVNTLSVGGVLDKQPESFVKKYNEKCLSKGMLETSDILPSLTFLLSDSSSAINGQNIIVDDGFTL